MLHRLLSGEYRSWAAATARCGLAAMTPFYGGAVAARNLLFDLGIRRSKLLPRPAISVGNLSVGGTGKTPMVIDLVRRLVAGGQRPAVLLRGYRGGAGGSDEAILLASATDGAPVEADPDRAAAARAVLDRDPKISVFVLDDAFQHRQVRRDLDIVLVDAAMPMSLARLLPRGLLREPLRGLCRADAVVITHAEQADRTTLEELDRLVERIAGKPPLGHAEHRWNGYRTADEGKLPLDALAAASVFAFCGIANPAAFARMARTHVGRVLDLCVYADHHPYADVAGLERLRQRAAGAGADFLLTTEKDWVKLRGRRDLVSQLPPIVRPQLTMAFLDGEAQLEALLRGVGEGREE